MFKVIFSAGLFTLLAATSFAADIKSSKALLCQVIDVKSAVVNGVEKNTADLICRMKENDPNSGENLTVVVPSTGLLTVLSSVRLSKDRAFMAKIEKVRGELLISEANTSLSDN